MNTAILRKVDDIIACYGQYDEDFRACALTYDDVPDVEKMELAAIFLAEDRAHAYEAIVENKQLDSKLIPALINVLCHPGNSEARTDVVEAFQTSLVDYYRDRSIEALAFRMEFLAWDKKYNSYDYEPGSEH